MQYKDWDGNLLPDPAPRIHNVHIGDVIKIKENEEDPGRWGKPLREYKIIEIYPRIVLTMDKKTGFRRSFSYGDLLTMGLENQDSEIETMRRSYAKDQRKESISITRSSFNPDYDPEKY